MAWIGLTICTVLVISQSAIMQYLKIHGQKDSKIAEKAANVSLFLFLHFVTVSESERYYSEANSGIHTIFSFAVPTRISVKQFIRFFYFSLIHFFNFFFFA